jgi:hypothetical protein
LAEHDPEGVAFAYPVAPKKTLCTRSIANKNCESTRSKPLRQKSSFLSNLKLIWAVQSPTKKYFAWHFGKSEL